MAEIKSIIFVGTGNVSSHLAQAFDEAGLQIMGFYNRNIESAKKLAEKHDCDWGDLSQIRSTKTDLIIISVSDKAISKIALLIPNTDAIIVHTSGSIEMNALQNEQRRIGVFYPLQTFSKGKEMEYSTIPIILEAQNENDLELLEKLGKQISKKVYRINSAQRKKIHIAAVFSSNFTNYLFHIAADLLEKDDIPFEVIQPLLQETVEKIKHLKPYHAQTGPAVREDHETINNHLYILKDNPDYHEIYKLLSHHIIKSRKQ